MANSQPSRKLLDEKSQATKKESLERLGQQLFLAESNGDTALAKKIKAIINRIKSDERGTKK